MLFRKSWHQLVCKLLSVTASAKMSHSTKCFSVSSNRHTAWMSIQHLLLNELSCVFMTECTHAARALSPALLPAPAFVSLRATASPLPVRPLLRVFLNSAMTLEIRLSRPDRTYRLGEMVVGVVAWSSPSPTAVTSLTLQATGQVRPRPARMRACAAPVPLSHGPRAGARSRRCGRRWTLARWAFSRRCTRRSSRWMCSVRLLAGARCAPLRALAALIAAPSGASPRCAQARALTWCRRRARCPRR